MEAVFKASALRVHSMYSYSSLKTIIHCAGPHSCILSVKHTHMHTCETVCVGYVFEWSYRIGKKQRPNQGLRGPLKNN